MQVTEIGLGNSATDTSLLKLSFDYGTATENNGSMKTQTMVVPTVGANQGFTAIQTYNYDALNRIQSATETVSGSQTWKQTFQYDRFGNRRFDAANTTTLGSCPQVQCNPLISTSDNRFSSGQGYGYDKTGNVTADVNGNQFLYDAENHQKEIKNSANQTVGLYLYDGEGRRIKKISNLETTIFVYDGGGQLAAEYSTQTVQTPQTSYLTTDHLGSPRVITNQLGAVTSRKDFAAFGDETITAQRTQGLGYKPDEIRQDYTGYQKDDESGLEYAQARYYNTSHGRFTSVDPLTASATIKNPQTFNRYSYVTNSPYKFVDPLGLQLSDIGVVQTTDAGYARSLELAQISNFQNSVNEAYKKDHPELFPPELEFPASYYEPQEDTENSTTVDDPPIINLVGVTVVDSLSTLQDEYARGDTNDDATIIGGSTYDARVNISEVQARIKQGAKLFLRVDLNLIGKGDFTSAKDTSGTQSTTVSSRSSDNMSVVTTPKDLNSKQSRPTVNAAATSVSVYTPITISDASKPASLVVTITATANYRANHYENGKYQIGTDRDKPVTKSFKIKIKYTP